MDIFCDASVWIANNCAICIIIKGGILKRSERKKIRVLYEPHNSEEMEYQALLFALDFATKTKPIRGASEINIYSDSQNVVDEVNLIRQPKEKHNELYSKAREYLSLRKGITITWVPREKNIAGQYLDQRLTRLKIHLNSVVNPNPILYRNKKEKKKRYTNNFRKHKA